MRRTPIWRAIAETAPGTMLGTAVGLLVQPHYPTELLSPPYLGLAGFLVAAARLWIANRSAEGARVSAR